MRLVRKISEFTGKLTPNLADWTAIVPAAGRATRLEAKGPKILYPVLKRPILNWLIDLIKPLCRYLIVIASPAGAKLVQKALAPFWRNSEVLIQVSPTGMGDAIALCDGVVKTKYTLVMWGDQITPRQHTLAACMTLLESDSAIHAVIPTMERESPYIHFKRDDKDQVVAVYQARETEERMAQGESDCGVFCFRTEELFRVLRVTRDQDEHRGAKTQENNFLSLLPLFQSQTGSLVSIRLADAGETVGINTPADAETVGKILLGRKAR